MVFCQNKTAVLVVEKQENEGYEEEEEEEEDTDADLDTDDDDGEDPISGKILGLLLDLFFPLPSLGVPFALAWDFLFCPRLYQPQLARLLVPKNL